jgi:hypothetical protein
LKLAGGWRCFKNLRVLQKKKRSFDWSSNVYPRIVESCKKTQQNLSNW